MAAPRAATAAATLSVAVTNMVTEGDAPVYATVSLSVPVTTNVEVELSSSDTTAITVPGSVIVPAGQTLAQFAVTIIDDSQIDGPQSATIRAQATNWVDGTATLTVRDNESTTLSVFIPSQANETAGIIINGGSVQIAGTLPTNLTVTLSSVALSSNDSGRLMVPAAVTILAGYTLAYFDLTLIDNSIIDGSELVAVTAQADGFASGSAFIRVDDDETPSVALNPYPPDLSSNITPEALSWSSGTGELIVNGDFETGTFVGWSRQNTGAGNFFINDGTYVPDGSDGALPPYSGNYSVVSSQTGPGQHVLYQDVTIPQGASGYLSWVDRIRNYATDFADNQSFRVEIRRTDDSLLEVAYRTQPGDSLMNYWVYRSFNISPYAGQTIRIAFVEEDQLGYFNVHLDNVSMFVQSLQAASFDVYFGTNPNPTPAEFKGNTTKLTWALPRLAPLTTYYWQIVSRNVGTTPGRVWRFTTRGVDHFDWSVIATPQLTNQPFSATITAKDQYNATVRNFTGPVALSGSRGGGASTNRILGNVVANNNSSGNFTLGYSFTPNANLLVTHVRHYSGTKVSIWTDTGALILSQPVNSIPGTWVETPLLNPVVLSNGLTYRVAFYVAFAGTNGNSSYFWRNDLPSTFSDGIINQTYEASGDQFPFSVSSPHWWFVDLRYTVGASLPVALSSTNSGYFNNGAWIGNVAVRESASGVSMQADDGLGHTGKSNPFDVLVADDIQLSVVDSPSPVAVGANLTYTLTAANPGPSTATGVTLTNVLPANLNPVMISPSQGSCSSVGGTIQCSLGNIAGGAQATVTIVVIPTAVGVLTNLAVFARDGSDPNLTNNTVVTVTQVTPPSFSIANVSLLEGNVRTTPALFPVVLSGTHTNTATVSYFTTDGTATAGSDYFPTNGTLTFSPSVRTQFVTVLVRGDTVIENDETFSVSLVNPSDAVTSWSVRYDFNNCALPPGTFVTGVARVADDGSGANCAIHLTDANQCGVGGTFFIPDLASGTNVNNLHVHWRSRVGGDNGSVCTSTQFGLPGGDGYSFNWGTDVASSGVAEEGTGTGISVTVDTFDNGSGCGLESCGGEAPAIEIKWQGSRVAANYIGTTDAQANKNFLRKNTFVEADFSVDTFGHATFVYDGVVATATLANWTGIAGGNFVFGSRTGGAADNHWIDDLLFEVRQSAGSAVIGQGQAVGTIVNDDGVSGLVDHFTWAPIPAAQYLGVPFPVTITAQDPFGATVTNFTGTVALSGDQGGGLETNRILGDVTAAFSSGGDFSLGYSFTPNTNLVVTHVRHYAGTKVSIWTDAGLLLLSQPVSSIPGTWVETPLSNPLVLLNGSTYRVAFYSANNSYYWRNDLPSGFPDGIINQTYEASGDQFPFSVSGPHWWFVDLRYTVGASLPVAIAPTNSGNFTDGVWNGNLSVSVPATNVVILADDGDGHYGSANPFSVLLHDDIGLTVTASPEPVGLGENLTYTLVVTNIGPSMATGVTLVDQLGAGESVVSVVTSRGACTTNGNTISCNLGTLGADTSAIITVVASANLLTPGSVACRATIARAEPDLYLGNNAVTNVSTVLRVAVSISDASVIEGNTDLTNAAFAVTVYPASTKTVRINYATADGTAIGDSDYVGTFGTMVFGPGETNKTLNVPVIGDIYYENDETFLVNLSSPINAVLGRSTGTGTIVNDDAYPGVSVWDAAIVEGDSGANDLLIPVSLFPPSGQTVTVQYYTSDGSAVSPSDYAYTNGTVTFNPGETNATITVSIHGDTTNELDEMFYVYLNSSINANINRSPAIATILNDDFRPVIAADSSQLLTETCPNGSIDPNEVVTVNFVLRNVSPAYTISTNLTAILLPENGITPVTGFGNYGAIQSGNTATQAFTFVATGICGSTAVARFQLKDGTYNIGTVSFPLQLGGTAVVFSENFDHVAAPGLPAGWTATLSGAGSVWRTVTDNFDTSPNAVFATDPSSTSDNQLNSPSIPIATASAQLAFTHYYYTESGFDYCWLEISIGGGAFTEMIAAGGSFASNGYFGRGWNGYGGGFITTIVNLPAAAAGKNIRLRWRMTSDGSVGYLGWYVDSVTISEKASCCYVDDVSVAVSASPDPVPVGVNLTYTITVANTGPSTATGLSLSNRPPPNASLVGVSQSQGSCAVVSGIVQCSLGALAAGSQATVTVVVLPSTVGSVTNIAVVSRSGTDTYLPNNTATTITAVTLASISISDVSVTEGDAGTTAARFPVVISGTHSSQTISVAYSTTNDTAFAGADFVATNGTLVFPVGISTQFVTVLVNGDTQIESNETFRVTLSNPVNGVLGRSQAVGTIVNDDGLPGRVDHFVWSAVPSPQYVNQSFPVMITAQDALNATVAAFTNTVALRGQGGGGVTTNTIVGNLVDDISSSGTYTLGFAFTPSTNIHVTHVRQYKGDGVKVTIWTDSGALVTSQNVINAPANSWVDTALTSPVDLVAGTKYRVGYYTGNNGPYHYANNHSTNFPNGSVDIEYYYTSGDGFPNNVYNGNGVLFLVDLRYTIGQAVPLPVGPSVSGSFTGGVWTGSVSVLAAGTNVQLIADDLGGHAGLGNLFNVFTPADLALSLSESPNPISTNSPLTYTLSVYNPGPLPATSVILSNYLPAGVGFVSANPSQGTCTNVGGVVTCNLGTLAANTNLTVQILVNSPATFGNITNFATVTQDAVDPILTNNSAVAVTTVLNFPPLVSITSPTTGSTYQFPVDLPLTVSVSDADGVVVKVEYFNNGVKFGESTNNPFSFTWTNGAPGNDSLTAKATDNGGVSTTSAPVNIYIYPPPPGNGIGLYGEYFDNLNYTGTRVGEVDSQITFNEGNGNWPPSPIALTTFSARWSGRVQPFYSDTYTFYTDSDDGVRLYINGQLIIDNYTDHTQIRNSGTIALQAGQLYSVRLEYYQNLNTASLYLLWSSTNQFQDYIPQSQLYPLPLIVTNPVSRAVLPGSNVTFSMVAWGQAPLAYQWLFNGTNLPGATATNLVLTNVQASVAGGYSMMVSNTFGVVTSAVANLVMAARPTIVSDPQSQIVLSGSNVTLTASATGTLPLTYRWRKFPVFLTNSTINASNSSFVIKNAQLSDAGTYTVVVTNLFGSATNRLIGQSSNAFLSVVASQPANLVTNQGSDVTLLVSAATTDTLSYFWRFNLTNLLADATDATLILTNVQRAHEGSYHAVVTNSAGSVTTLVATLTITLRDSDANGLGDDWEIEHFGHIGVDPADDPDHDGMSNLQEYIAGTDPLDPMSVLKLQLSNSGGGGAMIRFPAMARVSYTLQYQTNLSQAGSWRNFTNVAPQPGTNLIQILDPAAGGGGGRYYRVVTPQQ